MLMLVISMCSCGSDDDDYVGGFSGNSKVFWGTWYLMSYSNGWEGITEFKAGEIIVTFTNKGEVQVINKREDQRPIPTSTFTYSLIDIEKSIFTGKPGKAISFNNNPYGLFYSYSFSDDGTLYISAEAYDGSGYALKKLNLYI